MLLLLAVCHTYHYTSTSPFFLVHQIYPNLWTLQQYCYLLNIVNVFGLYSSTILCGHRSTTYSLRDYYVLECNYKNKTSRLGSQQPRPQAFEGGEKSLGTRLGSQLIVSSNHYNNESTEQCLTLSMQQQLNMLHINIIGMKIN